MEEERHPYPDCFKWIKDIFKQFNYDSIEMLTDLNLVGNTLKKFGAVYIGGGNSFKLMHELRSSGFDVKAAFDGLEGFDMATKFLPDVIITGIVMPRMSGFALISKRENCGHPEYWTARRTRHSYPYLT